MIGPPGAGKTMIAKRIPTILPYLTFEEALETTKIHSVMGFLGSKKPLISTRPFRSPHHTISDASLVGGGTYPRAGEVSLAHNGVLFLDEFPEFRKNVLEVLRQPLEDGEVTISRVATSITYPANFMLVSAMNPCPCGYYSDPHHECSCNVSQIQRYRAKISGPLLDRIDIHIEVPALRYKELSSKREGEPSHVVRKRVNNCRKIQLERFKGTKIYCNAQMTQKLLKKYCQIDSSSHQILQMAIDKLGLSARAYTRILKISRTIADLNNEENILTHHISEAIQYRSLDRDFRFR
jgi:magnesium chelatase family protein